MKKDHTQNIIQKIQSPIITLLSVILLFMMVSCQKSDEIGSFVHYSLYPIDGGKVEFLPSKNAYELGDIVTMVAIPDSGRSFYRWEGDTICYDSAISIEVNENAMSICAVFPLKILKDSILILGAYPDSVLPKGEIAYFNFSLNSELLTPRKKKLHCFIDQT